MTREELCDLLEQDGAYVRIEDAMVILKTDDEDGPCELWVYRTEDDPSLWEIARDDEYGTDWLQTRIPDRFLVNAVLKWAGLGS
jgi:hypothetical protein